MNLSFTKEPVLKALSMVAGVVEKKTTLPILSCFHLSGNGNNLFVTGTNLETELTTDCVIDPHGEFAVCLPRRLLEIIRAFPDDKVIVMMRDGDKMHIKCGRSRFTVQAMNADDYPILQSQEFPVALPFDQAILKGLLSRVSYAIAKQDVRYYLNGVMVEVMPDQVNFVATDGHRMGVINEMRTTEIDETKRFIIPGHAISELKRLLTATNEPCILRFNQNHCQVQTDTMTFTSKLIDGIFPDYRRVMRTNSPIVVKTGREALLDAIKRTQLVLEDKTSGTELAFSEKGLTLTARYQDQEAFEEIETEHQGDSLLIGFNALYIKEVLETMESESVQIGLLGNSDSMSIESTDADEGHHTIMSMRL